MVSLEEKKVLRSEPLQTQTAVVALDPQVFDTAIEANSISVRADLQETKAFEKAPRMLATLQPQRLKLQEFLTAHHSQLVLGWMVFCSSAFTLATQLAWGVPINGWVTVAYLCFLSGTYVLNWLSEIATDFVNDPSRLKLNQQKHLYWGLTLACYGTGTLIAVTHGTMGWSIPLLISIGVLYSFPLIPWYRNGQGWVSLRLKDITLVKSLTVGAMYTFYAFYFPVLFAKEPVPFNPYILYFILGYAFIEVMNTVYDDLLDVPGDSLAGVKTVPVVLGIRNCEIIMASICGAALLATGIAFGLGALTGKIALFLTAHAAYPFTWIFFRHFLPKQRLAVDLLVDATPLVSGVGIVLVLI